MPAYISKVNHDCHKGTSFFILYEMRRCGMIAILITVLQESRSFNEGHRYFLKVNNSLEFLLLVVDALTLSSTFLDFKYWYTGVVSVDSFTSSESKQGL